MKLKFLQQVANDLSDEISKLNELHKSGVLTQEEFEKAKSKLLNN
jgi:predicted Zn-dependent peptidase